MHGFILNPTRSARRTLRHVCVATLDIPPEKCGCDDARLAFLRNATQHQAGLGSPKRPHIRAARKIRDSAVKRFNPFRRCFLDPLYQLSLRDGSRKRGDDMNMISNTADAHEFGTEVAADCGYISMNARPHV